MGVCICWSRSSKWVTDFVIQLCGFAVLVGLLEDGLVRGFGCLRAAFLNWPGVRSCNEFELGYLSPKVLAAALSCSAQ